MCQRDAEAAKRLELAPADPEEPEASAEQPQADCERPSLQTAPAANRRTVKRKKSKHKHKDQVRLRWFTWLFISFFNVFILSGVMINVLITMR